MVHPETADDTGLGKSPETELPSTSGIVWLVAGPNHCHFTDVAGELTLGRTTEADLALPSASISRRHVRVRAESDALVIQDLQSRNGTFINGTRHTTYRARHGDLLRLGSSLGLIWHAPGDAPEPFGLIEEPLYGGSTLRRAVRHLNMVAKSPLSVTLIGPTGTGKEALARAIHQASGRKGELVAINCATLPEQLADAQLFGHKKGSFTGAGSSEPGYFRVAQGGTLFLDEVVELPLEVQAKLLRATQEDEYIPVGESRPVRANVRILVASQAPLEVSVRRGRFRQDLAARLDGFQFRLPELKGRREDVIPLFLRFFEQALGRPAPEMSVHFAEKLCLYSWPNNVRELGNAARQVAVLSGSTPRLGLDLLPETITQGQVEEAEATGTTLPSILPPSAPNPEWEALREALISERGNVRKAAEGLGISRGRAYRLITAHGESADDLRKLIKG